MEMVYLFLMSTVVLGVAALPSSISSWDTNVRRKRYNPAYGSTVVTIEPSNSYFYELKPSNTYNSHNYDNSDDIKNSKVNSDGNKGSVNSYGFTRYDLANSNTGFNSVASAINNGLTSSGSNNHYKTTESSDASNNYEITKSVEFDLPSEQAKQLGDRPIPTSYFQDKLHPTTSSENDETGQLVPPVDAQGNSGFQDDLKDSYLQGSSSQDVSVQQSIFPDFTADGVGSNSDGDVQAYPSLQDSFVSGKSQDDLYTPPPLPHGYDYHAPTPPPSPPQPPPPPVTPTPYYYYPPPSTPTPTPSNQYLPVPPPPPPVPPSNQYLPATTPPPPPPPVYTHYYLGFKIWFIPLIFSAYFGLYVAALLIKNVTKHKVLFPMSLYAAAANSRDNGSPLDLLARKVSQAVAAAALKYLGNQRQQKTR